jgi:hypothetical protein
MGLTLDAFPEDPAEWMDTDLDGYGDNVDAFPENPADWSDRDLDGVGDNADSFPDDPAASVDQDKDGRPDAWNPGKSEKDSTTGLVLDSEDRVGNSGSLFYQTWFIVLMIGLTILIVISIVAVLAVAIGWRRGSSSEEEDLIDGYRNEITSGKIRTPSRAEISAIVSQRIGKEEISPETGAYVVGLFPEE